MNKNAGYRKKVHIIQLSLAKEISHGMCVSNLALAVAREMKLPEDTCYELAVAGFLHDVGKLELKKYLYGREEDTLTIEEMKYVRMHADLSAKILEQNGYPKHLVEWVHAHHENCDGSGYPRNLTREEIPLGARIIRICDVFAALTSDRPYRKSFDADAAVELMIEEAKNYDLKVFLAFLNVIHEKDLDVILDKGSTEQYLGALLE
ncbi:MAG: HD domain-containing protein [Lachnospiraceae bacterium]|nr:HD domain-containing protein [Lachnospiraceae bacterium]MDD3796631.1 HD domain-containing protein [Lachnospiraceae bacterium]